MKTRIAHVQMYAGRYRSKHIKLTGVTYAIDICRYKSSIMRKGGTKYHSGGGKGEGGSGGKGEKDSTLDIDNTSTRENKKAWLT